jgi:ribose 5-phosphate isomerase B
MTIFIAADHRGFELKNKIIEYLQEKDIRVEDLGAYEYNKDDDYPDFAKKVAQAVLQNPENHLGVVICGSGVGVSIAANRFCGIRCGLGFDENQIKHAREDDYINVLAIAADFFPIEDNGVEFEKLKKLIDVFINTRVKNEEKYLRRIKKLDNF